VGDEGALTWQEIYQRIGHQWSGVLLGVGIRSFLEEAIQEAEGIPMTKNTQTGRR